MVRRDAMEMRKSKTLEMLRAGKTVISTKCNTADPRIVEIAAIQGIACVWVDIEHVANDYAVVERQINAAKIYNTDVLVRVPRGSYSDYIRPLELDATGIMVPHVMSVEDAEYVVHYTRFHPIGRRPVDGGNADAKYGLISQEEYNRQANEQRFLVFQIEDPEAMDDIDAIAAAPGYDILFYGPGDFSHSIGHSGEMSHPDVVDGFRKVAEAAKRHGKFAGTVGSMGNAQNLIDMGYRFINIGADVITLGSFYGEVSAFAQKLN